MGWQLGLDWTPVGGVHHREAGLQKSSRLSQKGAKTLQTDQAQNSILHAGMGGDLTFPIPRGLGGVFLGWKERVVGVRKERLALALGLAPVEYGPAYY